MSDDKQPKPQTPWLDPRMELTDEEEAALDAIFAAIPRHVVEAANAETHAETAKEPPAKEQKPDDK